MHYTAHVDLTYCQATPLAAFLFATPEGLIANGFAQPTNITLSENFLNYSTNVAVPTCMRVDAYDG